MTRWVRFLSQIEQDFRLWLLMCAYFSTFRATFIWIFRARIDAPSGPDDVAMALLQGMRYDAIVASYFVLLPILGSLHAAFSRRTEPAERLRRSTASVLLMLASLLCVVAVGYYQEYGETFNERLFGLVYDDTRAIAATLWKGYHPIPNLLAALGLTLVSQHLAMRWLDAHPRFAARIAARTQGLGPRIVLVALLAIGLGGGLRGSLGRRPAQLKDAAITGDTFLDQTVLNPFTALRYALQQEARLAGTSGLDTFLPDRDVAAAARRMQHSAEDHATLDGYLLRTAGGRPTVAPRHVFLIVGEGLSAWPLAEPWTELGLGEDLERLAGEGLHVARFVPAAYGTIESLGAIMTGLADAQLRTNYQPSARQPYPTSIAPIFTRLGYRTRLFYGGFLSWQRVGEFAKAQGFDEVYGGGSMGDWAHANEWGVDDEELFDFVLGAVKADTPSFNLIMTTSLHPPYDVDVAAEGFVPRAARAELATRLNGLSESRFPGHYWYASRCIAEFVHAAAQRLAPALLAVTGDHPSRVDLLTQPSLLERRAVPLILYGPEVLRGLEIPSTASGSHLDIAPTLIELAAPPGFAYHALGKSLFAADGHPLGIGQNTVIGDDYILDLRHGERYETLANAPDPEPALLARWREEHDALHGLSWWRIKHGAELTAPR